MQSNFSKILQQEKEKKRASVHSFHRYFGKFIPAIPGAAIDCYTNPGDTILDTFVGSGTSMVEAKFKNRNAIGIDINPISILIAKVKTTHLEESDISAELEKILSNFPKKSSNNLEEPYCVNIDHWFWQDVKQDLLKLRSCILEIQDQDMRDFFLATFSAFMRSVSNCDPMHVFPGYSKRLRALDAAGKRKINVIESYKNAIKKRAKEVSEIPKNTTNVKLFNCSARQLPADVSHIKLVVINPPYISSIRYLETLKIEMGWLGLINSQKDYLELDKKTIGTERFYKNDFMKISTSHQIAELNQQIENIYPKYPKMAKVVSDYFDNMTLVFQEISRVLDPSGHLVIKISDSKVRTEHIPTHQYFIDILEDLGFRLIEKIRDDFDQNSRSLLTTRNSYSGIMNFDWILIFEKP